MTSATACVHDTTEPVRAISEYCLVAKPITFARKPQTQVETAENKYDTEETARQVEQHDVVYDRLCRKEGN